MKRVNALVRNAALYAAETWPAHEALLKQANSMQLDRLKQMMHIHRRTGEAWGDWQMRSLRTDRVQLHKQNTARWSAYILQQIWKLWGHMARGGGEVRSMLLLRWKNLQWWRAQQADRRGVRHAARYNSQLDVERALERTAGENWMAQALQRDHWRKLAPIFVTT